MERFSALQRAEIAEIDAQAVAELMLTVVSVLFNEPKLLKLDEFVEMLKAAKGFSALQRAEIAEM